MEEHKSNEIIEKLNQELLEKQGELDRLNKMKGRLFSIVSHDIKSPIGIVTGFAEVLINHVSENYDVKDDPQFEIIKKHLNDGKGRLLTLLEDLISWVKIENGSMPFRAKLHEAKPIIQEVLNSFQSYASEKDITIDLQLDDDLTVYGDTNTLKVIFKNVLNNAVKFTKNGGKIEVLGVERGGFIAFEVSDNGIGIPKEIIDRIFEATKDKIRPGTGGESGVGLGLSVVRGFVALNQGEISFESKEGEGTTCYLKIPSSEPQ